MKHDAESKIKDREIKVLEGVVIRERSKSRGMQLEFAKANNQNNQDIYQTYITDYEINQNPKGREITHPNPPLSNKLEDKKSREPPDQYYQYDQK